MTTQDKRKPGSKEPDTIPASGATDGIRYILDPLHSKNAAPSDPPASPNVVTEGQNGVGSGTPGVFPASDATGLAGLVVDDADAQLPDGTTTVRGGQLAHESKRGAY
jgi:hypothetical protein